MRAAGRAREPRFTNKAARSTAMARTTATTAPPRCAAPLATPTHVPARTPSGRAARPAGVTLERGRRLPSLRRSLLRLITVVPRAATTRAATTIRPKCCRPSRRRHPEPPKQLPSEPPPTGRARPKPPPSEPPPPPTIYSRRVLPPRTTWRTMTQKPTGWRTSLRTSLRLGSGRQLVTRPATSSRRLLLLPPPLPRRPRPGLRCRSSVGGASACGDHGAIKRGGELCCAASFRRLLPPPPHPAASSRRVLLPPPPAVGAARAATI